MNVVEVENLAFAYDSDSPALNGVTFRVKEGDYVAIIGHNGSGKSTIAKVLMGLLSDYTGTVKLFDTLLEKESIEKIRSRVGIVFQNPDNQFVGSTVADDIAFGLENRCIPHEKMQPIIEKYASETGMIEFLNREPESLSGGQKQRVAIAGVLAMKPDLVIFDEATAMLDPKGKAEIAAIVSKMRKENPKLTILSITHDVEEAASADEVLVINDGKAFLQGTPNEVFSHEKELHSIQLDIPFVPGLINELKRQGFSVPENIKTLEALEDYLCQ